MTPVEGVVRLAVDDALLPLGEHPWLRSAKIDRSEAPNHPGGYAASIAPTVPP